MNENVQLNKSFKHIILKPLTKKVKEYRSQQEEFEKELSLMQNQANG